MSRTHEVLLANHIARLDRLIDQAEELASSTSDEETLRSVDKDLVRWRDSRGELEQVMRRTKSLNRFVFWTLATFCISFAILFILAFLRLDGKSLILVALDVLVVIGAGIMYVVAILVRDAVALGHRPWRFSLRSLLVTTTVIAVVLGVLVYALKK